MTRNATTPALAALLTTCAVVACRTPPATTTPRASRGCHPSSAPELPAAPPLEPIRSHLTLAGRLSEERLRQEIGRELPRTLASGRRTEGPGLRISYVVRRGDLDFQLDDDTLLVTVPITVTAEVCKTFGPLCPIVGRCTPSLRARASVPVVLDEDYSLGKSHVEAGVLRGCSILGFDATQQIATIAAREATTAERRIDEQIPDLPPYVEGAWAALHQTLPLQGGACLQVVPEAIHQARPQLTEGMFLASASLVTSLRLEHPCASIEPPPQGALPPLEVRDSVPPGIRLRAPLTFDWEKVGQALRASMTPAPARLTARGVLVDNDRRILLELAADSAACGSLWLLATPVHDAARNELRLRAVEPVEAARSQRREAERWAAIVEESARIPVPLDLTGLGDQLQTLRESLVPAWEGIELDFELAPPTIESVGIDPAGLHAIAQLRGRAAVVAE